MEPSCPVAVPTVSLLPGQGATENNIGVDGQTVLISFQPSCSRLRAGGVGPTAGEIPHERLRFFSVNASQLQRRPFSTAGAKSLRREGAMGERAACRGRFGMWSIIQHISSANHVTRRLGGERMSLGTHKPCAMRLLLLIAAWRQ